MLKEYTYWLSCDETEGYISVADHVPDLNDYNKIYSIYAETWEEAMAIHNLREGYSPYYPEGEAEICLNCSNFYYPKGSGECFCGHKT